MTYYDPVLPIRNLNNFAKTASFYFGPCATAFLQVYRWLYKRTGSPEHIIDHYNSFSGSAKERNKIFNFDRGDITKLEDIKQNPNKINKFDITLLYKLIQYGTGNDKVASPNDNVWSKNCPLADADKLEHLLFLVKKGRNDVGHVEDSLKNLSDYDVTDECNNLIGRLSSIIQQSGEMAEPKIDQSQINEIKEGLKEDLERIRDEENQLTNLPTLLSLIKKDLVDLHKEDLKRSFENELRGYCPPDFVLKADQSECTTENLLPKLSSQILIVDGESGMGKTSLTKYLFRYWLLDETEKLDLSCYEVIFRIDCRNICTRDISQFLEDELPNAHRYLSNTESLKKHLKQFKVLWIMDGFDESTSEFMGFMKSLLENLSSEHKIVITTRPDCLNELKKELPKNASEATLKNFTPDQVYEDAEKYLRDQTKSYEFHQFYENLSDATKKLMKTPGNLNLCLDLWIHNPDELKGKLSMHKLYEKISLMQFNQLVERHRGKTNIVNEDDLKSRVEKWFYDVLCKIAAESFVRYFKFTTSNLELKRLKDEAINFHLIENYCLSTFLNAEQPHEGGLRYVYRHRTQQEVLASLYLTKSGNNKILELLENANPFVWIEYNLEHKIDMLKETCNGSDLVRISDCLLDQTRFKEFSDIIQKIWRGIFNDAKGDEEFRDAFRNKVSSWPKPFLYLANLNKLDIDDLKSLIDCLLPDVSKFDIELLITSSGNEEDANRIVIEETNNASLEFALRNLIKVFKIYKNKITFGLNLVMKNLYPDLLNILKEDDYHTLVKRIDYTGPAIKKLTALFDFPNLKEVYFYNYYYYDDDGEIILNELNETNIVSQLVLNKKRFWFLPSFGNSYLHPSCVAHFNLNLSDNYIEQLSSFLSVSKKFREVSFELSFFIKDDSKDLPEEDSKDVISKSINSLNIKVITFNLFYVPLNCILFKLVNTLKLETVSFYYTNESITLDFENLFKLWNCSEQKDLKEVGFKIGVKDLKMLYKHIPMNLIDITNVDLFLSDENDVNKEDIPENNGKKFKYIAYFQDKKKDWRDYMSPEVNECVNQLRQFHLLKY